MVGAIRWDAWYAPGSEVTEAVARALSPPQYHWRAPFFSKEETDQKLSFPPVSQSLMDLEIRQAAYAGLDYWAFVAYPPDSSLSVALKYYLSSSRRTDVKFCMYTAMEYWGSPDKPSPMRSEHIGYFKDDAYVRVHGDRPLYILGFINEEKVNQWGGPVLFRKQIDDFRAAAQSSGAGNPYIVIEGYWGLIGPIAKELGADAVGDYAITYALVKNGKYSALTQLVEQGWKKLAQSGLPVVSPIMAGWDRRPRVEHPSPWENPNAPQNTLDYFYATPTPEEFERHLQSALAWQSSLDKDHRSPAVLIYAWNEYDEGGWLAPTFPCNTERLDALHTLLSPIGKISNPRCSLPQ